MEDRSKDMCEACPWNHYSEEAQRAQNYGCLPTPQEMLRLNEEEGQALSCHSNGSCVCKGLAAHLKEMGNRPAKLKTHKDWYRGR